MCGRDYDDLVKPWSLRRLVFSWVEDILFKHNNNIVSHYSDAKEIYLTKTGISYNFIYIKPKMSVCLCVCLSVCLFLFLMHGQFSANLPQIWHVASSYPTDGHLTSVARACGLARSTRPNWEARQIERRAPELRRKIRNKQPAAVTDWAP